MLIKDDLCQLNKKGRLLLVWYSIYVVHYRKVGSWVEISRSRFIILWSKHFNGALYTYLQHDISSFLWLIDRRRCRIQRRHLRNIPFKFAAIEIVTSWSHVLSHKEMCHVLRWYLSRDSVTRVPCSGVTGQQICRWHGSPVLVTRVTCSGRWVRSWFP